MSDKKDEALKLALEALRPYAQWDETVEGDPIPVNAEADAVVAGTKALAEQPAQQQNPSEPIEFLSGFLTERLAIERGIEWTPAIHDLCNRAIEEEKLAEQPAQQEPVAWMDGYRNIYSLEEKAAGCEDAVIPLVPATLQHWSDCAVHNEPAYQSGKCDCGGYTSPQPAQQKIGVCGEKRGACGLPCEPCEGKTDPDYVQQPAQQPLTDTELINQGCRYQTELTQPVQQQEPEVGVGAENGAKPSETRMDTGFSGGGNPPAQQQVPRAARGDWGAKRKQPAQQEPVALDAIRLAYLPHDSDKQPGEVQEAFVKGWNGALDTLAKRGPLYTSPPASKPWVGLTAQDRYQAIRPLYNSDENAWLAVEHSNDEYEAIEAKLREKNA